MASRTEEQQENREWWGKRAGGYIGKHKGMTKVGLVIGVGFAIPFIIASLLAIGRGEGLEAVVWFVSAVLAFGTAMAMALWSSRRD